MYKIVIDSCGELAGRIKQDGHYETFIGAGSRRMPYQG